MFSNASMRYLVTICNLIQNTLLHSNFSKKTTWNASYTSKTWQIYAKRMFLVENIPLKTQLIVLRYVIQDLLEPSLETEI